MPFASALGATPVVVPWTPGTVPTWNTSPAPAQNQVASQWCWLATAASADAHYGGTSTQCQLADSLLSQTSCCTSPHSVACDRPGDVSQALQAVMHHSSTTVLGGTPPALTGIRAALAGGEPPVGQIRFPSGGDHVVLLAATGVDASGAAIVRIGDPAPLYNPTDLVWAQAHRYRGGVSWTHVCWTKP